MSSNAVESDLLATGGLRLELDGALAVSTVKELIRGADQRNPVTQAAVERRAQLPLLRALIARQAGAVPEL